jgi:hypothetical protein
VKVIVGGGVEVEVGSGVMEGNLSVDVAIIKVEVALEMGDVSLGSMGVDRFGVPFETSIEGSDWVPEQADPSSKRMMIKKLRTRRCIIFRSDMDPTSSYQKNGYGELLPTC